MGKVVSSQLRLNLVMDQLQITFKSDFFVTLSSRLLMKLVFFVLLLPRPPPLVFAELFIYSVAKPFFDSSSTQLTT